ncbi:hypothetical protein Q31b_22780 [Novipirellula aureliae]|uniref:DUF1573 domain-containing protein n=1 Tax=Novipirellula aureliae TaxID=2527966 RepID=A0A5C6E2V1_9BACT|nr:DUF1573 domain-containing protein [Novipirellula aureliae]TWU43240.1 hypothetical protein Q31b_22780 [Novipirellula aureliae]
MTYSTAQKIAWLLAASAMMIGVAVAVGSVVTYKPYGVPDHRREEYDQIVRDLQEKHSEIAQSKRNRNAIAFAEQTEFDFGLIDPGTEGAEHEFVIRNRGIGPLVLSDGGSSCKCTVAEIADPIIPSGESRNVKLVWNVGSDITDNYEQQAIIQTNDPQRPEIELTVRGKVRSKWAMHSDNLTQLRGIPGKPIEASCVIYSQLFEDFIVLDTETSVPNIAVSVEAMSEMDRVGFHARSGYELRFKYRAASENSRRFDELVRVNVFDVESEEVRWIEVPLSGTFGEPVVFLGPAIDIGSGLDLGTVETGSKKTWSFLARFRTEQEVSEAYVKDVKPDGLIAKIEPSKRVKNTFRVTLSLASEIDPQRFRFDKQGYVEVADRANPKQSNWMPLHGEIILPPRR